MLQFLKFLKLVFRVLPIVGPAKLHFADSKGIRSQTFYWIV